MIELHLDNAIQKVRNGEEISTVVSSYPAEIQTELQAMLEIINLVQALPTKTVPIPNRRKLYLNYSPVSRWQRITGSFRLVPTVIASLILVIVGTALGARASVPGDKLFAVKKTYESLQIKLATTPEKRATLQLEIAAQRFQEAQKVLATNNNDNGKKEAINELNQQTALALNDIKQSAVSISTSNPGLVTQAEEITKSQSTLVAKANPTSADKSAVQQSNATLNDIKKIIAAANEETGATIVPNSTIDITGTINSIKDQIIKIGNNSFTVNDITVINDADNNSITLKDLNVSDEVTIEAVIKNSDNIARTITIVTKADPLPAPADKTVKEAPKDTSKVIPAEKPKETKVEKAPAAQKAVDPVQSDAQQQSTVPQATLPADPKDTFGGFIPEPPIALPGASQ